MNQAATPKRMTQSQLDSFTLVSERYDLNGIAGTLGLLASQLIDANEGGENPRPIDDDTMNRWCDAVSFLRMSVRCVIGRLETIETEISGKPASRPRGAWDFWEGGEP